MKKGARWSEKEFQQFQQRISGVPDKAVMDAPTGGKYGNVKVEIDGIIFDSGKEGDYYKSLKILKAAGKINDFEIQKVYKIIVNTKLICKYIADFVVYWPDGSIEVIDVKGDATARLPVFRLKRKLMKATLGIVVKIV